MQISTQARLSLWVVAAAALVAAAFLVVWAGLPDSADYSGYSDDTLGYVAPEIGEVAPPFHAELFTGEELDLSALRGQWVVVNFWATWCVPCRVEMPELQAFYEDHDDIAIIGVNIGERRPVIAEWVTDFDLTFDIALDPRQVIYAQYRVPGQPTTFVIAPDGIITNIFYGPITADTLQSIIVDG